MEVVRPTPSIIFVKDMLDLLLGEGVNPDGVLEEDHLLPILVHVTRCLRKFFRQLQTGG